MRILLLNQFFYPDGSATSQLLTDLARSLVADGHSVRVICGRSSYAASDCLNPPAVEIVRTPGLPFGHGPLARICSYTSFLSKAVFYGFIGARPDVILTLTTPPALSTLGTFLKTIRSARHFIWEMDVYPDIAVDLQMLKPHSWLTRALGATFDHSRRKADGIIALGECMRARLIRRGVPEGHIHVAENWADGRHIYPVPFPVPKPLRILYSGNLGLAHDVKTIRTAIFRLRSDSRFHFSFAGSGPQRVALESFCRKQRVANVSFAGYWSYNDLPQRLGACHIGLVTQKPETLGSVVPSKTYGLMAAGRPILYIGPPKATPAQIVRRFQCGWQIDPGDTAGLISLLESLAAEPSLLHEAGARGRIALLQHYDLPMGVARICSILGLAQSKSLSELAIRLTTQPPLPQSGNRSAPVAVSEQNAHEPYRG